MARPIEGQKKVTTVWLEPEIGDGGEDKTKFFYCFNCRIPVFQYVGNVVTLIPGGVPYEPYTEHKCKGSVMTKNGTYQVCGHYYIIAGTVYTTRPEMV